jgi:hypothetical protein
MNYRQLLLDKVDALLTGSTSVPEFEAQFHELFSTKAIPPGELNKADYEFFAWIQENLGWTVENPAGDRAYGYRDYGQFIDWVKREREAYLTIPGYRRHGEGIWGDESK